MSRPFLKFFRSFDEISLYAWEDLGFGSIHAVPESISWDGDIPINFEDIKLWEHIYQDAGNLGIFAAHSPCAEIYMVVFYPILGKTKDAIKIFSEGDAVNDVVNFAKSLGINLNLTPS